MIRHPETLEAFRGLAVEKRPRYPTLFEDWLKKHGWDMNAFARRLGVNRKMVIMWAHGQCIPTLPYAYLIEQLTKGEVFAASWLGTEIGKLMWNQIQMKSDKTARRGKARPSRVPAPSESVELVEMQDLRQDAQEGDAESPEIAEDEGEL